MAPGYYSRNRFCSARYDKNGKLFLYDRVPFSYREISDTTLHTTSSVDTLDSLAAKYFATLRTDRAIIDPSELWWIIADFQPPIDPDADVSPQPDWCLDPTLAIPPATTVHIPSVRTVLEQVFDEARRAEHEA